MLEAPMGSQSSLHFFKTDGGFSAMFGNDSEIMEVFQKLLVSSDRKNHSFLLALLVDNKVLG
jgi:hypothetical protein